MKCQECKFEYPDEILSPMFTSEGVTGDVCGICALNLSNKLHRIDRKEFQGETAEWMRQEALSHRHKHATHYVHKNSGNALFVKDKDFFEEQGGVTEEWGQGWIPVIGSSIGDARKQAAEIFDVKLSHIHYGEA